MLYDKKQIRLKVNNIRHLIVLPEDITVHSDHVCASWNIKHDY